MMITYIVKRTNFVCPDDWYLGECPLTGQFTRTRIGDFSQEQLRAWLEKDPATAGKYVIVVEVPQGEEPQQAEQRKPGKQKANAKKQQQPESGKQEAETPEDAASAGVSDNYEQ